MAESMPPPSFTPTTAPRIANVLLSIVTSDNSSDGIDVDSPLHPPPTTDHGNQAATPSLTASDLCTALDTLSIKINDASRMLDIAVQKMVKGPRNATTRDTAPEPASDDDGVRKLRQEWEKGQHILSAIHSLTSSQNLAAEKLLSIQAKQQELAGNFCAAEEELMYLDAISAIASQLIVIKKQIAMAEEYLEEKKFPACAKAIDKLDEHIQSLTSKWGEGNRAESSALLRATLAEIEILITQMTAKRDSIMDELVYYLDTSFSSTLQFSFQPHPFMLAIRSSPKEFTDLDDTIQLLNKQEHFYGQFCKDFLCYFITPLLSCRSLSSGGLPSLGNFGRVLVSGENVLIAEKRDSDSFVLAKQNEPEKSSSSYQSLVELDVLLAALKMAIQFLSSHLSQTFLDFIGPRIWTEISSLLITDHLTPLLPSRVCDVLAIDLRRVTDFEEAYFNTSRIMKEEPQKTLSAWVNDVMDHFADKIEIGVYLSIRNELLNSIESTPAVATLPSRNVNHAYSPGLSSMFAFAACQVSTRGVNLANIVDMVLFQAAEYCRGTNVNYSSSSFPGQIKVIVDKAIHLILLLLVDKQGTPSSPNQPSSMSSLFPHLSPHPSPSLPMPNDDIILFAVNDLLYLSHTLLTNGSTYARWSGLYAGPWILALQEYASNLLDSQIAHHLRLLESWLRECPMVGLDSAKTRTLRMKLSHVVDHFTMIVAPSWNTILPLPLFVRALDRLLNGVMDHLLNQHLLRLIDIPDDDSRILNDVLTQFLQDLEPLTFVLVNTKSASTPSSERPPFALQATLAKLTKTVAILTLNMSNIMEMVRRGELTEFTAAELVGLLMALFADSRQRQNNIYEIQNYFTRGPTPSLMYSR